MKKRTVAILTLAIFLVGVFGSSVTAMATGSGVSASGSSAYSNAQGLTNKNGGVVEIPGMMDLRFKNAGASEGQVAYCYNATKTVPPSQGVSGYELAADQSANGYKALATKPSAPLTLYDDVLDVVWNGYPYYGGGWKGVTGDPMLYKKKYNMGDQSRLKELYDIQVTQAAVWKLTDTQTPNAALVAPMGKLLAKAKVNPAPKNFKLNLYDGSKCKVQSNVQMQHLLVCGNDATAARYVVNVNIDDKWYRADGKSAYIGKTPDVYYELYEGDITPGEKPLRTFTLGSAKHTITMINDHQKYTLREVLISDTDKFTAADDQVLDFSTNQSPSYAVSFSHTEITDADPIASVILPVGAEVTLDDGRPEDASFSLLLKDSYGNIVETKNNLGRVVTFNPLTFKEEGTYVYTLTELQGDNKNVKYDTTTYELTVTVTKTVLASGKNAVLKIDSSWKKNGEAYNGLVPIFTNTTQKVETATLTVNKVWASDKASSRPKSVNMQLYRDGSAYGAPVQLDANNNWSYTWKDLDKNYKWTVDEPTVPTGYTKTSKTTGTVCTITNTGKVTAITTPSTTKPTTTKPSTTRTSNTKTTKPTITKPDTTSSDRSTPQTGDTTHLDWWVTGAIISLAGMCLIGLMWMLSRRKQYGKK